ncbi:MobA/MobL family protein [[Clostridium] symbiosum]|uniref:MobQ family relaxase n=1 Tax=Clostridium symbiosum TaxID=1512 RepID=UPI00189ED604|nr:MobQ family relaxase [[Clostridium] symbiosum]MDB2035242.1 MobA/MobL family protein [[Clostridium] symbiosum]
MAIYHLSVKIIGRNAGRSSVAAAAYRSGDILTNQYDGLTHDYSRKNWIEHTEILLPDNAPKSFKDRSTLWNAVELAEKSSNAQLAREVEIALPKEITLDQQTALVRAYIEQNFVSQGMCADFAIHNPPLTDSQNRPLDIEGNPTQDPDKMIFQNPHTHIMLTMRPINDRGEWQPKSQKCYLCRKDNREKSIPASEFKEADSEGWRKQYQYRVGKKKVWLTEESAARRDLKQISKEPKSEKAMNPLIADWNSKDSLFRWRESWASMCNQALRDNNINQQIDHRSYESQGINKVSSVHLGPSAYQAEKRGQHTELGNLNRGIAEDNIFLNNLEEQIKRMEEMETEHLNQINAKLEGLRSKYIAYAYERLTLSAAVSTIENQKRNEAVIAKTYAESMEQITAALENFLKTLDIKKQELELCSPLQVKKRKELIEEIARTEIEIQSLYDRREKIFKAYKADPSDPIFPEFIETKKQRIAFLRSEQAKINTEFWQLVEDNKERLKELRSLHYTKRNQWENFTKRKLKEHYQDNYNQSTWEKAKAQAPDISEVEGTGIRNNKSHRR